MIYQRILSFQVKASSFREGYDLCISLTDNTSNARGHERGDSSGNNVQYRCSSKTDDLQVSPSSAWPVQQGGVVSCDLHFNILRIYSWTN